MAEPICDCPNADSTKRFEIVWYGDIGYKVTVPNLLNDGERLEVVAASDYDRLKEEGSPGVMHDIDQAFYDLAIKERDFERRRVDRLTVQTQRYQSLLKALVEAEDRPCHFDGRGCCQEHGWFGEPGECAINEARKLVGLDG